MSSIRKWIASKVFSSVLSNDSQLNESTSSDGLSLFGSFPNSSSSADSSGMFISIGDAYRNATNGGLGPSQDHVCANDLSPENQSYFSVIYHHYKSRMRKNNYVPNNERNLITYMYQFYQANEELTYISSELDTFDGRKDTVRCSALVNNLKIAQDRVISLIFRIMDEIGCERASREYRLKFPDSLLTGEGIESLNSQIWFGAECLTGGSTITNNQDKSNYLRPIAINLTTTLEQIRNELRSCCNLPKNLKISKDLIRKLENFDNLFSSFEYDYVKAMLEIKTCEDIENLQELTFLFSDTLSYALKKGLISKDDVDGCQPSVMIALPRLSIVRGLLQGYGSVVCKQNRDELTSILRPYHSLLLEFHEFLTILSDDEIFFLEKLLSINDDNMDLTDNDQCLPLVDVGPNQDNLLSVFNKFFKHAKRMKDSGRTQTEKKMIQDKSMTNRYISASVDFLLINNRNETNDEQQSNNNNGFSPFKSNETLCRFNSLPNINFYSTKTNDNVKMNDYAVNQNGLRSQNSSSLSPDYSTNSTTTSTSSCPSISITCSSSSSISVELDFLKRFKDMLKRTQLKTFTKNRNFTDIRSTSSGFYNTANNCPVANVDINPRAKTAFTDVNAVDFMNDFKPNNSIFTPTTSAFSNHSIHFDFDTLYTDDLSQLTMYTKKILHQVFVMISRIADEFQTNYASELRNILRTVFLLQDMEDNRFTNECVDEDGDDNDTTSMIKPVDVQIGQFVDEYNNGDNMDKVEEAFDAEYLYRNENIENFPSTSYSSHELVRRTISESNKCDNINNAANNAIAAATSTLANDLFRTSSLENLNTNSDDGSQVPSNSCAISSSYPSVKGSTSSLNNSNKSPIQNGGTTSSFVEQKIRRQLSRQSNASINSSNSSNSYRSLQQSQVTSSSATTIDEANRGELPPFIFSSTSNSTPALSTSQMIPILGSVSGPSSATNLLLPPIWIPDDLVTTCKSCAQGFNLIRRRHHCRRCGQIFCHQCSNNFISLKCFGYAKPVRVCNPCLALHKQSEPRIPNTTFGAS